MKKQLPKFNSPFEMFDYLVNDGVRFQVNISFKTGERCTECHIHSVGNDWMHIFMMPVGLGHWIRIDAIESIDIVVP
jgi:hypothetical protein